MKKAILSVALAIPLIVALPARAQSGCEDSPENPTLVLAGLAGSVFEFPRFAPVCALTAHQSRSNAKVTWRSISSNSGPSLLG